MDFKLYVYNFTKNGGVEQVVYDLAIGLNEIGIDVTIVGCLGSKSPNKLIETIRPNRQVLYKPSFKKTGVDTRTEKRHYKKIRKHLVKFDIIHDHSQAKMSYQSFKKRGGRMLGTFHNKIYPTIVKLRNMVSISKIMTQWLRKYIKNKDIPVVYNGVNLNNFPYFENKGDRFLFFSEIGVFKGAKIAYEIAKETGIPIDFAGKTGDMSDQIRLDSALNIKYYGEVPEWKKRELFQNSKALIFPTGGFETDWQEPFGLVMIESMASGTPVIAANNGAVPEIIKDGKTGFICDSKEEILEKIEKIDSIKPIDCRKWVEDNFSHQSMSQAYLKLYNELLDRNQW